MSGKLVHLSSSGSCALAVTSGALKDSSKSADSTESGSPVVAGSATLLGSLDVAMGSLSSDSTDDCGSGSRGDRASSVAEPVNEEPLLVNEELLEVKGLVEIEGEAESLL